MLLFLGSSMFPYFSLPSCLLSLPSSSFVQHKKGWLLVPKIHLKERGAYEQWCPCVSFAWIFLAPVTSEAWHAAELWWEQSSLLVVRDDWVCDQTFCPSLIVKRLKNHFLTLLNACCPIHLPHPFLSVFSPCPPFLSLFFSLLPPLHPPPFTLPASYSFTFLLTSCPSLYVHSTLE